MRLKLTGQIVTPELDGGTETYVFSAASDFTAEWTVDRGVDKYTAYIGWAGLDAEGSFSLKISGDGVNYDVQPDSNNDDITKTIDDTDGFYTIVNPLAAIGNHQISYTAGDVTEGEITIIVTGVI